MRQLAKAHKPQVLQDHEEAWTRDYLNAATPAERKARERWGHTQIRQALRGETLAKCAYCEGTIEDVSFSHVEHVIPKSVHPELAHRWGNLTLACGRCNLHKSDYYSPTLPILSPYEDGLDLHLHFYGDLVEWRLGSHRGEVTVTKLRLNRIDLAVSRMRRLNMIRQLLERWHESEGPRREILEAAIRLDAAEGEFTRTVFAYLAAYGFPVEAPDATFVA